LSLWSFSELVVGLLFVLGALTDAFETIVLPRSVSRKFRLTYLLFRLSQKIYGWVADRPASAVRQRFIVSFAPLQLFVLIIFWGVLIVFGYSLISMGLSLPFRDHLPGYFGNRLYFSATTFLTFGFGDFVPITDAGKWLAVAEATTGFMFLALVIGYVPVFYSAFSRREQTILLLDSKAGSDPTACEILRRHAAAGCLDELPTLLKDWEGFAAQLLENFLSYPILAYYRSQHDDQSWLNSMTSVMDACAICMTLYPDDGPFAKKIRFQARATFAMARHVMVDFAYVIRCDPMKPPDRLPPLKLDVLTRLVEKCGVTLHQDADSLARFQETRALYEPFNAGLSNRLKMDLPEWVAPEHLPDNWETSAWDGTHF
jgi:hypothetical protein